MLAYHEVYGFVTIIGKCLGFTIILLENGKEGCVDPSELYI